MIGRAAKVVLRPRQKERCSLVLFVAFSILIGLGPTTQARDQLESPSFPPPDPLLRLELLFDDGDFPEIIALSQELIDYIKLHQGHFEHDLIELLQSRGDAHVELGNYDDAIASYEEAIQIVRMTTGPYTLDQIDLAHRLADTYVELRDGANANRMYELTYEIALKEHGDFALAVLPELARLLTWYEQNRFFRHARILHLKAMTIVRSNFRSNDLRSIEMKRVFANGLKNSVFPPRERGNVLRGFFPNVPGYEWKPFQRIHPYSLGRHALRDVLEQVESNSSFSDTALTTALLELADWEQIFGQSQYATRLYREAWHLMESRPETRDSEFSEPKLLYVRLPPSLNVAERRKVGVIDLNLTISKRGRVIGRRTAYQFPRDRDREFAVRKAVKFARFRPAFVGGEPVKTTQYAFSHVYGR